MPSLRPADVGLRTAIIVDDVEQMRMLIDHLCRQMGLATVLAIDGRDARRKIEQNPIDLVITDIEMPHWSGLDLLGWIRNAPSRIAMQTPVIVTSSRSDAATRQKVRSNPNSYFLSKPIVVAEFNVLMNMLMTSLWLRRSTQTR